MPTKSIGPFWANSIALEFSFITKLTAAGTSRQYARFMAVHHGEEKQSRVLAPRSTESSESSYCRFAGVTLLPWKTTARTFSSA